MLPDPSTGAAVPALRWRGAPRPRARSSLAAADVEADRLGPRAGLAPALRASSWTSPTSSARRPIAPRWTASSSCRAPTSSRRRPSPGTCCTPARRRWSSWAPCATPATRTTTAPATSPTRCRRRPTRACAGRASWWSWAGCVLPADDATKTDSQRARHLRRRPTTGPLGRIADGALVGSSAAWRPAARSRRRPTAAAEPVALLTAVVSTDGDLLRAAVRGGAAGIVVEATGAGNTDPDLLAAAREAMAAGIPVVLASRVPGGRRGARLRLPGRRRSLADLRAPSSPARSAAPRRAWRSRSAWAQAWSGGAARRCFADPGDAMPDRRTPVGPGHQRAHRHARRRDRLRLGGGAGRVAAAGSWPPGPAATSTRSPDRATRRPGAWRRAWSSCRR